MKYVALHKPKTSTAGHMDKGILQKKPHHVPAALTRSSLLLVGDLPSGPWRPFENFFSLLHFLFFVSFFSLSGVKQQLIAVLTWSLRPSHRRPVAHSRAFDLPLHHKPFYRIVLPTCVISNKERTRDFNFC